MCDVDSASLLPINISMHTEFIRGMTTRTTTHCPYHILEVDNKASSCDIRRAYKALALIHHPDKVTGDEERFKKIATAYSLIGEQEHRQVYDRSLLVTETDYPYPHTQDTHCSKGTERMQVKKHLQPSDIEVTLRDIVFGCNRMVLIPSSKTCIQCQGTGAHDPDDFIICLACMANNTDCRSCGGTGGCNVSMKDCRSCKGAGTVVENIHVIVVFPEHVCDQQRLNTILVSHDDDVHELFLVARVSHLFFKSTHVPDHPGCRVTLTPSEVRLDVDVTLAEILCGFTRVIDLLGEKIALHHARYDVETTNTSQPFLSAPFTSKTHGSKTRYDLNVYLNIVYPSNDVIHPFRKLIKHMF